MLEYQKRICRRNHVEREIREVDCRLGILQAMRSRLGSEDEQLEKAIRSVESERRGLVNLYQAIDEDTAPMY